MRIMPTSKIEWLQLSSLPFKTYVFSNGFFYPFWLFSMPGTPGTIGGPDYSVIEKLTIGDAASCLALLIIASIQAVKKNRKDAAWNLVFAVLALFFTLGGIGQPQYR